MTRRLLAVSWEMPPQSGPRAVQVTRTLAELGRQGWRSRVICFGPRSDRYQQDHQVSLEALSNGMAVPVPVASPEEWFLFRALWRLAPPVRHLPDEKRVWIAPAVGAARRELAAGPADLVVTFAQPWSDHLIGLKLKRETGLPWVAHFSDPWVDSPYAAGPGWVRRRNAAWERDVIGEATRVVFVNEYTRERVMRKYPDAWRARASVVPQGHEGGDAPAPPAAIGRPLRIVYTGRFYHGIRTPTALVDALAEIHRARSLDGRLMVEFVGADMARYEARAKELGLAGCTAFTGRVNPERAKALASAADVLLTIDAPEDTGEGLFLPSKLIDYLPLQRPILGLAPLQGPSADILRELGYPVVAPDDRPGIRAAIERLLDAFAGGRLAASPAHASVARRYDIAETTRAFARVLEEAVSS